MSIRTPFAYLLVSACCFAGHNIIMIGVDKLGGPLWLAVLLSFGIIGLIGYTLHSLVTFQRPFSISAFTRYIAGMSVNIPVVFVITWFWHSWLGFIMLVAAPLASVCMLLMNFLLSRWAIVTSDRKKTLTP